MFQRLCLLQNAFNQTSKTVEMTRALLILRLRGFVVGGRTQEKGHGSSWCALSLCKIFKAIQPAFCHTTQSQWLTVKDCEFRPRSQFHKIDRLFLLFTNWLRSQDLKTFSCWDEAGGSAGSAHVASVSLIFRATDRPSHQCPLIPWQKDDDDDYEGETEYPSA